MIALSVSEYCVLEWSPARRGPSVAGRQGDARMSAAKFTKRDLKKRKKGKDIKKRKKKRKEKKRGGRKEMEETKERKVYHVCVYACVCM